MTLFEQNKQIDRIQQIDWWRRDTAGGRCLVEGRWLLSPWLWPGFYLCGMLPCHVKKSKKCSKLH